jgi:uncharacterized membrane protein
MANEGRKKVKFNTSSLLNMALVMKILFLVIIMILVMMINLFLVNLSKILMLLSNIL